MRNVLMACLIWLFLGGCINANAFSKDREVLLATGEWAPYTSAALEGYGFFSEIVTATITEMGYHPKLIFVPWKRAEALVKEGRALAAFPYIVTDDRKKSYYFSQSIYKSTGRLFYNTKRFPNGMSFKQLSDLKTYVIGGVLGYWYGPLVEKEQIVPDYVPSEKHLIKMLYNQRLDLAPLDELVGWDLIGQHYPEKMKLFRTVDTPLNQSSLHLIISKKYPDADLFAEQFNVSLEKIKKKKIYSQILKKYNMPE